MDIDGLACAIAYAELLRLEGEDAAAVLCDPLNASVTPELRAIAKNYQTTPVSAKKYVIVDMSDTRCLQTFVPLEKVVEILDHHFGFEDYWYKRL